MGGLFVAVILKHADSILRGFASAAAVIIATVGAHVFLGNAILPRFAAGTAVVIIALLLYVGAVPWPRCRVGLGARSWRRVHAETADGMEPTGELLGGEHKDVVVD